MRTYQQVLATVEAAGYPPLNEDYIRYTLEMGRVRWEVRFNSKALNIKRRFPSLQLARIFRDAVLENGLAIPDKVDFLNPKPKNRNLVVRQYHRKEYTGQDIILGPPTIIYWN